ncbi:hypothetical protein DUNSADRAFT_16653 [Dunaliella salina]|uniref:Flagellar associated protein n=1 Tax=Dunaliella salina TaxID=3046 RepID=A0ABQ7G359_DUNSA|nr:hypothetical protein DUNSADRAFT_16653 [Dunaliella salina]|eukprot:KAF5829034.1 hypothetical protein DUNSADRAFT_16653 [Dunaliella salina]
MAEFLSPTSTQKSATRERVRVYQPALLEDALLDSATFYDTQRSQTPLASTQGLTQVEGEGPEDDLQERIRSKRAAKQAELRAKDEAFRRATERKKQEAEAQKEAEFQQMYSDVLAGMEASGIMGESQETLNHRKKVIEEKQRALHKEWQTQVFDKIQGRLDKALSKTSPRETEARLQAQMDDFLRTGNTKAGIYRDVICEQDYDPLSTRSTTLKVQTGDIFDPLKRDWIKARNERLNMGLSAGSSGSLGKDTFDTKMWNEQNVRSTPYGHCVDKTGAYVLHPVSQSVLEERKSKLVMDHYNYPNKDNAAAAEELGLKSGKGMPPRPGAPENIDVLTNQCHLRPEVRKGDIWLEQRGKGHPPPPASEVGRVDMREVLHPTASGDRERHGGDECDHPPLPAKPRDIRQNMSCLRAEETLHPVNGGTGRFVDSYGS